MEALQTAPASEAAETVGLLTQLAPYDVAKILPVRLSQWPRTAHDRTVRQLSSAPAEFRASMLVALYESLDPMIRPLAIDEMGMSGHPDCIPKSAGTGRRRCDSRIYAREGRRSIGSFARGAASQLLQHIMDARQLWRWSHPDELRIAAAQSLMRIDATMALEKLAPSGLDRKDLTLEPTDPEPNTSVIRQRRYARLRLSRNLIAHTTNLRENIRLTIPELNLGGGIGSGERHLAPGSLLTLKFTHGRPQHQGAGRSARRASPGHGLRVRRDGSRRAFATSKTVNGTWRAADGRAGDQPYQAARPCGHVEDINGLSRWSASKQRELARKNRALRRNPFVTLATCTSLRPARPFGQCSRPFFRSKRGH
jgi:hypothetical protein